ncbi:adenylate/guanylate cyclase domain-containing protein [Hujiaoplasma nucleasis]|uniref:Adenylate/guanylate cyclase domain-containing protein n=1 Tax=Hujiaoplasma nucleasis TaxID=2725268 RepID=A0A7L6N0N7_9MOLU|nr:adenylate/guanylate cyclase domain-containing protein [Hujiaoplasma nucleasis]QLY39816.1 adenylate/guanylate cyclase domain-containing protein [Hujiaoplasma nucleasis]
MGYDYEKGKQRVESILDISTSVENVDSIPKDESRWTYDNGIKSWVTAIFVDLRGSTEFFAKTKKEDVARTIRAYSSEIIEIMKSSTLVREIGVRGDCVYGVFSSPNKQTENELFNLCVWLNTYIKMLNKLLKKKSLNPVRAGIGMATSEDLIIKAGKKGSGINEKVWIGEALAKADYLSKVTCKNYGNETTSSSIAISNTSYINIKEFSNNEELLKKHPYQDYFTSNSIKTEMNNWIDSNI